jgi:hypothetical protein
MQKFFCTVAQDEAGRWSTTATTDKRSEALSAFDNPPDGTKRIVLGQLLIQKQRTLTPAPVPDSGTKPKPTAAKKPAKKTTEKDDE